LIDTLLFGVSTFLILWKLIEWIKPSFSRDKVVAMKAYSFLITTSNLSNKRTISVTDFNQQKLFVLKPKWNWWKSVANFILLFKLSNAYTLYDATNNEIFTYSETSKTTRSITNLEAGKITTIEIESSGSYFKAILGDEIMISKEPSKLEIRKQDSLIGLFQVEADYENLKGSSELIVFTEFQKAKNLEMAILLYFNEVYYNR